MENLRLNSEPVRTSPPIDNRIPRYRMLSDLPDLTPEEEELRSTERKRLRATNKWEWSLEDLLFRCREYNSNEINYEDGIKEMAIYRKYLAQLHGSQGFDIDVYPSKICLPAGAVKPGRYPEKMLNTYFKGLADLAIQPYNDKNKRNFQVLQVERVNETPSVWTTYYLTFKAKDASSRHRSPKTFQAKVTVCLSNTKDHEGCPRVELCRRKSEKVNDVLTKDAGPVLV